MVKPQTMLTQAFTQPQQNELLGGLKALPINPSKCSPPIMSMIYLRKLRSSGLPWWNRPQECRDGTECCTRT
jgi:hypothetical protein